MDDRSLDWMKRVHKRGALRFVLVHGLLGFSVVALVIVALFYGVTKDALGVEELVGYWWPFLAGLPVFGAAFALARWHVNARQLAKRAGS